MTDTIRWGILGTGWIANEFAQGLAELADAELVAVGSRRAESANRFADRFQVPRRHAGYQALAEDPDVDVIYVATPNPMHRENCLLCLASGKPVLCEKPFALNAGEAHEMIQMAREKELFLMEAMWTRFFPLMRKVRALVNEGAIGEVQMLVANLCIRFDFDPSDRRYALELGGGALLDLGVYPLSLASMIMGPPSGITTLAHLGETGIDEQAGIILGYDQGRVSTLYTSIRVDSPVDAILLGTQGQICIHPWWIRPETITLSVTGQETTRIELPFAGNGYQFEAAEVMACLRAGKLESDLMPLDETLSIIKTMDAIRAQWGLRYPGE
ncbi:MAG TPA: Gfo/Idh/MocA family oxidoreductase [Anaerolineae bacterium]|nr:Gfo/Idh/MocA family oxidoreductase [Anaerolineae bacterium]